jgi:hypothetical protein
MWSSHEVRKSVIDYIGENHNWWLLNDKNSYQRMNIETGLSWT